MIEYCTSAMDIKFYYRNFNKSLLHETIIVSLTEALSTLIALPNQLEICIYDLPNNTYGGVDKNIYYRLAINSKLMPDEIPSTLVHELIHVHQRHIKLLEIKNGMHYWRGIPYIAENVMPEDMEFSDYKNCPWEIDVDERLVNLLTKSIELANKQHLDKLDNKSN
jgi:hypothetical protein